MQHILGSGGWLEYVPPADQTSTALRQYLEKCAVRPQATTRAYMHIARQYLRWCAARGDNGLVTVENAVGYVDYLQSVRATPMSESLFKTTLAGLKCLQRRQRLLLESVGGAGSGDAAAGDLGQVVKDVAATIRRKRHLWVLEHVDPLADSGLIRPLTAQDMRRVVLELLGRGDMYALRNATELVFSLGGTRGEQVREVTYNALLHGVVSHVVADVPYLVWWYVEGKGQYRGNKKLVACVRHARDPFLDGAGLLGLMMVYMHDTKARKWTGLHDRVFASDRSRVDAMTGNTHRRNLAPALRRCGLDVPAVTHIGRYYLQHVCEAAQVPAADIDAALHRKTGSSRDNYTTKIPVAVVRALGHAGPPPAATVDTAAAAAVGPNRFNVVPSAELVGRCLRGVRRRVQAGAGAGAGAAAAAVEAMTNLLDSALIPAFLQNTAMPGGYMDTFPEWAIWKTHPVFKTREWAAYTSAVRAAAAHPAADPAAPVADPAAHAAAHAVGPPPVPLAPRPRVFDPAEYAQAFARCKLVSVVQFVHVWWLGQAGWPPVVWVDEHYGTATWAATKNTYIRRKKLAEFIDGKVDRQAAHRPVMAQRLEVAQQIDKTLEGRRTPPLSAMF
jgi:hypothetical protein